MKRTRNFIALGFIPLLISAAVLVYRSDPFDPAPFPVDDKQPLPKLPSSLVNPRILDHSDFVGSAQLLGPEDLAYDSLTRLLYTGCADGWIKRVSLHDSVIEDWVNTGGRPLGIALTGTQLIVADAYLGLLSITNDKNIELLTNEAQGLQFNLTDGLDVAIDGTIYFTDASYKYQLHDYLYDLLESRPHGRLLSFTPSTNETLVLLENLYFPNGVALSPDQNSLIFCETLLKRCKRYWLQGSRKGSLDTFIDNLPGFPDNIHCDGQMNYWIAIASSLSPYLEHANRLQLVRKGAMIMERYISILKHVQRKGGIYSVDLQGNPTAHIYDPTLSSISSEQIIPGVAADMGLPKHKCMKKYFTPTALPVYFLIAFQFSPMKLEHMSNIGPTELGKTKGQKLK